MLYSTKGIVLRKYNYGNSSIIAEIYTDKYGKQKYIVKGIGSKYNKISISNFKPLNVVDIIANSNKLHFNHYIKEIKSHEGNIASCFIKLNIAFFISELLDKSLAYKIVDSDLFNYTINSIEELSLYKNSTDIANFHLFFIINLSKYLGFYPIENWQDINTQEIYFDMHKAKFAEEKPKSDFMDIETSKLFILFLTSSNQLVKNKINTTREIKRNLTKDLLRYYSIHNGISSEIKSYSVIETLFN
ncbi:MAG: DNA repair protein RecO [Solitalea-like symbiont of Acarus siro]